MTEVVLLDHLQRFVEDCVKDLQLEVPPKKGEKNNKPERKPPGVYKMRLPERDVGNAYEKRIPFIVIQALTGIDEHESGNEDSTSTVRIIASTYSNDGGVGANDVLSVITRIRTALLEVGIIGGQFHLRRPLERLIYPDDTNPYFFGEIMSIWEMPPIHRKIDPQIVY